jgi:WD40 repeat protein
MLRLQSLWHRVKMGPFFLWSATSTGLYRDMTLSGASGSSVARFALNEPSTIIATSADGMLRIYDTRTGSSPQVQLHHHNSLASLEVTVTPLVTSPHTTCA